MKVHGYPIVAFVYLLAAVAPVIRGWSATALPGHDDSVYVEYAFNDFPTSKDLESLWRQGAGKYADGVRVSEDATDKAPLFDDAALPGRVLRLSIPTFTVDGTVECFVYPLPDQPNSATLFATGSAGNTVVALSLMGKSLKAQASIATKKKYVTIQSEVALKSHAWNHVGMAWSSTSPMPYLRIFVNGRLAGSVADDVTPWNTEPNVLWVGSRPWWDNKEVWYTDLNFLGRIDDLRFSKRARSEDEIRTYLKEFYKAVLTP